MIDEHQPARVTVATILIFAFWISTGLQADVLESYQWQHRLVVVAAQSTRAPALELQKEQAAKDHAGWAERKLRLLEIVGGVVKESDAIVASEGDRILDRLSLDQDSFSVVLVGLDGTVKLRQSSPISNRQLFSLIDAMPMRREELRMRGDPY